jgi:hypothetical protein
LRSTPFEEVLRDESGLFKRKGVDALFSSPDHGMNNGERPSSLVPLDLC